VPFGSDVRAAIRSWPERHGIDAGPGEILTEAAKPRLGGDVAHPIEVEECPAASTGPAPDPQVAVGQYGLVAQVDPIERIAEPDAVRDGGTSVQDAAGAVGGDD